MLQNKPGIEKQQEERSEIIKIVQDWVGNGKENRKTTQNKRIMIIPRKSCQPLKKKLVQIC